MTSLGGESLLPQVANPTPIVRMTGGGGPVGHSPVSPASPVSPVSPDDKTLFGGYRHYAGAVPDLSPQAAAAAAQYANQHPAPPPQQQPVQPSVIPVAHMAIPIPMMASVAAAAAMIPDAPLETSAPSAVAPSVVPSAPPAGQAVSAVAASPNSPSPNSPSPNSHPPKKQGKEIILFGETLTLPDPSKQTNAVFTSDQEKALELFGLESGSVTFEEKKQVLQALFDGNCNTDKNLIMLDQCEPIRKVIKNLALRMLSHYQSTSKNSIQAAKKDKNAKVTVEKMADGSNRVCITYKGEEANSLSGNKDKPSENGKEAAVNAEVDAKVNAEEEKKSGENEGKMADSNDDHFTKRGIKRQGKNSGCIAALQLLYAIPIFRQRILQYQQCLDASQLNLIISRKNAEKTNATPEEIVCVIRSIFKDLSQSTGSFTLPATMEELDSSKPVIKPKRIDFMVRQLFNKSNDDREYSVSELLERLMEKLKDIPFLSETIDRFYHSLIKTTECASSVVSSSQEKILDFPLMAKALLSDKNESASSYKQGYQGNVPLSFQKLVEYYEREQKDETKEGCIKRAVLQPQPTSSFLFLTIHRSEQPHQLESIDPDLRVDIPAHFTLPSVSSSDEKQENHYHLFGVILYHSQPSPDQPHYSFRRFYYPGNGAGDGDENQKQQRVSALPSILYVDTKVSQQALNEEDLTKHAYGLLYQRVASGPKRERVNERESESENVVDKEAKLSNHEILQSIHNEKDRLRQLISPSSSAKRDYGKQLMKFHQTIRTRARTPFAGGDLFLLLVEKLNDVDLEGVYRARYDAYQGVIDARVEATYLDKMLDFYEERKNQDRLVNYRDQKEQADVQLIQAEQVHEQKRGELEERIQEVKSDLEEHLRTLNELTDLGSEEINDLFATLEIRPTTNKEEVEAAFRGLSVRLHPNKAQEADMGFSDVVAAKERILELLFYPSTRHKVEELASQSGALIAYDADWEQKQMEKIQEEERKRREEEERIRKEDEDRQRQAEEAARAAREKAEADAKEAEEAARVAEEARAAAEAAEAAEREAREALERAQQDALEAERVAAEEAARTAAEAARAAEEAARIAEERAQEAEQEQAASTAASEMIQQVSQQINAANGDHGEDTIIEQTPTYLIQAAASVAAIADYGSVLPSTSTSLPIGQEPVMPEVGQEPEQEQEQEQEQKYGEEDRGGDDDMWLERKKKMVELEKELLHVSYSLKVVRSSIFAELQSKKSQVESSLKLSSGSSAVSQLYRQQKEKEKDAIMKLLDQVNVFEGEMKERQKTVIEKIQKESRFVTQIEGKWNGPKRQEMEKQLEEWKKTGVAEWLKVVEQRRLEAIQSYMKRDYVLPSTMSQFLNVEKKMKNASTAKQAANQKAKQESERRKEEPKKSLFGSSKQYDEWKANVSRLSSELQELEAKKQQKDQNLEAAVQAYQKHPDQHVEGDVVEYYHAKYDFFQKRVAYDHAVLILLSMDPQSIYGLLWDNYIRRYTDVVRSIYYPLLKQLDKTLGLFMWSLHYFPPYLDQLVEKFAEEEKGIVQNKGVDPREYESVKQSVIRLRDNVRDIKMRFGNLLPSVIEQGKSLQSLLGGGKTSGEIGVMPMNVFLPILHSAHSSSAEIQAYIGQIESQLKPLYSLLEQIIGQNYNWSRTQTNTEIIVDKRSFHLFEIYGHLDELKKQIKPYLAPIDPHVFSGKDLSPLVEEAVTQYRQIIATVASLVPPVSVSEPSVLEPSVSEPSVLEPSVLEPSVTEPSVPVNNKKPLVPPRKISNLHPSIQKPVEPAKPVEPVEPVKPVEPIEPIEPVKPIQPPPKISNLHPSIEKPIQPAESVEPSKPSGYDYIGEGKDEEKPDDKKRLKGLDTYTGLPSLSETTKKLQKDREAIQLNQLYYVGKTLIETSIKYGKKEGVSKDSIRKLEELKESYDSLENVIKIGIQSNKDRNVTLQSKDFSEDTTRSIEATIDHIRRLYESVLEDIPVDSSVPYPNTQFALKKFNLLWPVLNTKSKLSNGSGSMKSVLENSYPVYVLPFLLEQAEEARRLAEKDREQASKEERSIIASPGRQNLLEKKLAAKKKEDERYEVARARTKNVSHLTTEIKKYKRKSDLMLLKYLNAIQSLVSPSGYMEGAEEEAEEQEGMEVAEREAETVAPEAETEVEQEPEEETEPINVLGTEITKMESSVRHEIDQYDPQELFQTDEESDKIIQWMDELNQVEVFKEEEAWEEITQTYDEWRQAVLSGEDIHTLEKVQGKADTLYRSMKSDRKTDLEHLRSLYSIAKMLDRLATEEGSRRWKSMIEKKQKEKEAEEEAERARQAEEKKETNYRKASDLHLLEAMEGLWEHSEELVDQLDDAFPADDERTKDYPPIVGLKEKALNHTKEMSELVDLILTIRKKNATSKAANSEGDEDAINEKIGKIGRNLGNLYSILEDDRIVDPNKGITTETVEDLREKVERMIEIHEKLKRNKDALFLVIQEEEQRVPQSANKIRNNNTRLKGKRNAYQQTRSRKANQRQRNKEAKLAAEAAEKARRNEEERAEKARRNEEAKAEEERLQKEKEEANRLAKEKANANQRAKNAAEKAERNKAAEQARKDAVIQTMKGVLEDLKTASAELKPRADEWKTVEAELATAQAEKKKLEKDRKIHETKYANMTLIAARDELKRLPADEVEQIIRQIEKMSSDRGVRAKIKQLLAAPVGAGIDASFREPLNQYITIKRGEISQYDKDIHEKESIILKSSKRRAVLSGEIKSLSSEMLKSYDDFSKPSADFQQEDPRGYKQVMDPYRGELLTKSEVEQIVDRIQTPSKKTEKGSSELEDVFAKRTHGISIRNATTRSQLMNQARGIAKNFSKEHNKTMGIATMSANQTRKQRLENQRVALEASKAKLNAARKGYEASRNARIKQQESLRKQREEHNKPFPSELPSSSPAAPSPAQLKKEALLKDFEETIRGLESRIQAEETKKPKNVKRLTELKMKKSGIEGALKGVRAVNVKSGTLNQVVNATRKRYSGDIKMYKPIQMGGKKKTMKHKKK